MAKVYKKWRDQYGVWWERPRYCRRCGKWKAMRVDAEVCLKCVADAQRRLEEQARLAVQYPWEAMVALHRRIQRQVRRDVDVAKVDDVEWLLEHEKDGDGNGNGADDAR